MARTRNIKRPRRRSVQQQRSAFPLSLLPEAFQAFLARRIVDIVALGLIVTGLYFLASLLTYSYTDPSWNTAVTLADGPVDVHNLMGLSGAWIADLLMQTLGGAAFVLPLASITWGIHAYNRRSLRPLSLRIAALMVCLLCTSLFLSHVPSGNWLAYPYLGSSIGAILNMYAVSVLPGVYSALILPIAALAAIAAFSYACAFTGVETRNAVSRVYAMVAEGCSFAWHRAGAFMGWLHHHNASMQGDFFEEDMDEARYKAPRRRRAPVLASEETEDESGEDESESYEEVRKPSAPVKPPAAGSAIPVVTPARNEKPQKPQSSQHRFNLSEEDWELPPLTLLEAAPEENGEPRINEIALRRNAEMLQSILADFGVQGEVVSIHPGPVVTLYELEPAPGVKTSRVIGLSDDIARSMSAISVRCAVVPGRNVIGIELPNKQRQVVYMQELLASRLFEKTGAKLPLVLGKDIGGQPILADLAKMPHLLVAGTTGSGKSVAVNTMILSLLFRLPPEKCRFIMIDPKMLELSVYDDIPHLLSPVVTEPGKAVVALKWAVHEMEERYRAMSKLGVRNIEGYNIRLQEAAQNGETLMKKVQTGYDPDTGRPTFEDQPIDLTELPYIVVVVDEFADLMLVAGKDVESAIQRLAQMARAAGIHLIMATQRPSVDVITGVIKANFPTRISFQVTSKIDSRTILGESGAEQLLGMGDMLYMAPGGRITRVHGPFVSDPDVEKVVDFLKEQGTPNYIDEVTEEGSYGDSEVMGAMFGDGGGDEKVDEFYDQAVALIAREGKASTSFVQRYFQIGYNRAARIIEEMERQGVISKANAVGKREILIRDFSDV